MLVTVTNESTKAMNQTYVGLTDYYRVMDGYVPAEELKKLYGEEINFAYYRNKDLMRVLIAKGHL